jgi:hypothetical protein
MKLGSQKVRALVGAVIYFFVTVQVAQAETLRELVKSYASLAEMYTSASEAEFTQKFIEMSRRSNSLTEAKVLRKYYFSGLEKLSSKEEGRTSSSQDVQVEVEFRHQNGVLGKREYTGVNIFHSSQAKFKSLKLESPDGSVVTDEGDSQRLRVRKISSGTLTSFLFATSRMKPGLYRGIINVAEKEIPFSFMVLGDEHHFSVPKPEGGLSKWSVSHHWPKNWERSAHVSLLKPDSGVSGYSDVKFKSIPNLRDGEVEVDSHFFPSDIDEPGWVVYFQHRVEHSFRGTRVAYVSAWSSPLK